MNGQWMPFIFGVICGMVIIFFLLIFTGSDVQAVNRRWQIDAIEHNAAHWEINKDGTKTFTWNLLPKDTL